MSRGPEPDRARVAQQALDLAREFFEPQLADIGLSAEQIERLSLEDCEVALERVNDAIAHPDSFGTYRMVITAEAGLVIAKASSDAHISIGILPILLERKSMILRRIGLVRPQEQLTDIAAMVEGTVADPAARETILKAIDKHISSAKSTAVTLQEQIDQTDDRRARQMTLAVELQQRKYENIWRPFLQRESIASMIGGLLLLAFGIALIVAMFVGTSASEVVTNSFLLILGYFFGQAVRTASSESAP